MRFSRLRHLRPGVALYVVICAAALPVGMTIGAVFRDIAGPGDQPRVVAVIDTVPALAGADDAAADEPRDLPVLLSAVPSSAPPLPSEPAAPEVVGVQPPSWLANAVVSNPPPGHSLIAIVIDDLGLDRPRTRRAVALKGPLTLAFLPYAAELRAQTAEAKQAGHELLVHMPMQPLDEHNNPGPGALTTELDEIGLRERLRAGLDRFSGYVGINNHMGSRFTSDRKGMEVVMAELKARGLLFLDSRTSPGSVGLGVARSMGVPHAGRDVFLDNDPSPRAVADQLAILEARARQQGAAIAIGHPHDGTLEALGAWIETLGERGFTLVPLSTIVRLGQRQEKG